MKKEISSTYYKRLTNNYKEEKKLAFDNFVLDKPDR